MRRLGDWRPESLLRLTVQRLEQTFAPARGEVMQRFDTARDLDQRRARPQVTR